IPSVTRLVAVSVRFRLCSWLSAASAWSAEIDFLTHKLAIDTPHFGQDPGVNPASFSGPIGPRSRPASGLWGPGWPSSSRPLGRFLDAPCSFPLLVELHDLDLADGDIAARVVLLEGEVALVPGLGVLDEFVELLTIDRD